MLRSNVSLVSNVTCHTGPDVVARHGESPGEIDTLLDSVKGQFDELRLSLFHAFLEVAVSRPSQHGEVPLLVTPFCVMNVNGELSFGRIEDDPGASSRIPVAITAGGLQLSIFCDGNGNESQMSPTVDVDGRENHDPRGHWPP